jgi:hypothetical protein
MSNEHEWRAWRLSVALDAIDEAAPESAEVIRAELDRLAEAIDDLRRAIDDALSSLPVELADVAPLRYDQSWTVEPPRHQTTILHASPVVIDLRARFGEVACDWCHRIDPRVWRMGRDSWGGLHVIVRDGLSKVLHEIERQARERAALTRR